MSCRSEWLSSKSLQTINAGEGVEKREPSYTVGGNIGIATMRTVWRFMKKLKPELSYDPAVPLLCMYLEKARIQKDARSSMFTAALFTTAKMRKPLKHPLTGE